VATDGRPVEVFANPDVDPIPSGLRLGDLVHGLRINGADPQTGVVPEGLEHQLSNTFGNLKRAVENAGGTLDNVAQVTFFLADTKSAMQALNMQWVDSFPTDDDRPTYKFMTAALPAGQLVELEFFAVLGIRRQLVNIAGVAHTNPIPMAVRMGRYLFTSRVLPMVPATGAYPACAAAQTDALFGNLEAVLAAAGMRWQDVSQGRLFLHDMAALSDLLRRWESRFDGEVPPLHPVHYPVSPSLFVMIELIAAHSDGQGQEQVA
jgi:enamine deaminase RidA (YjgF/YER057c/UK114 family)